MMKKQHEVLVGTEIKQLEGKSKMKKKEKIVNNGYGDCVQKEVEIYHYVMQI